MPVTAEAGPFEQEKIDALFAALKAEKWQAAKGDPGAVSRSGPALERRHFGGFVFRLSHDRAKDGQSNLQFTCGFNRFAKIWFLMIRLFIVGMVIALIVAFVTLPPKDGFQPIMFPFFIVPLLFLGMVFVIDPMTKLMGSTKELMRLAHRISPEHSPMLISLSRNLKCGKPLIDKLYQKFLVASSR